MHKIITDTVVIINFPMIKDKSPKFKYEAIIGFASIAIFSFIKVRVRQVSKRLRITRERTVIKSLVLYKSTK